MPMPVDLVLVRHGESEGNVAVKASTKAGDDTHVNNPAFRVKHSSKWRLTDLGIRQAEQAGAYIRQHISSTFDRYYVSPFDRTLETAAHLDLPEAEWFIDHNLRERERGHEDLLNSEERKQEIMAASAQMRRTTPFYWRPVNGESIANTAVRWMRSCETMHRDEATVVRERPGHESKMIVVAHGELMEAAIVSVTRMLEADYVRWTTSTDPFDEIHNCQIFHLSRRDPDAGRVLGHIGWWRSICPTDLTLCDPRWRQIQRPRLSNADLLAMVEHTPRVISG